MVTNVTAEFQREDMKLCHFSEGKTEEEKAGPLSDLTVNTYL